MRKIAVCVAFTMITLQTLAGDFELIVTNDLQASCHGHLEKIRSACADQFQSKQECILDESSPVASTKSVIRELSAYFSGQRTTIDILPIAFANGHVNFCGKIERTQVAEGLLEIAKQPSVEHARDLLDFIVMYRTAETHDHIRSALASDDLSSHAQERLRKLDRRLNH